MIEMRNLNKIYTTEEVETTALSDVNLKIKEGEFVAIMGPSGSGKTTLLNILGLLDIPSEGEYFFAGQDTPILSEKKRAAFRKRNLGFIFQNFNLIDELSVYENIELPLIYIKAQPLERKKRVLELIKQFNLLERKNHLPNQLSGGQQQRVAVARAIAGKPKLILADEPTGNLDSNNGKEVMGILSELHKKGATIIMVTHSQGYANYCQRIVYLFDGKVSDAPPE